LREIYRHVEWVASSIYRMQTTEKERWQNLEQSFAVCSSVICIEGCGDAVGKI
jgi:hypothetical protein